MMFVSMVHICTVIELQITSLIFWPSSTAGIFCKNCHEEATSHLSTIALQVSSKKHTTCIQLISESIQRILQCFVFLQEWCPILKGRKMNCCCLRMCYTIMRLLLNVSHLILQRSTITARFIGFNLPCFAPYIIYTLYKHCRFRPQFTVNAAASLFLPWWHLLSLTATCISTEERQKRTVYINPLLLAWTFVTRTTWLHVQSYWCTFNRPITYSLAGSMALSYNAHFYCATIANRQKIYTKI